MTFLKHVDLGMCHTCYIPVQLLTSE
jgi:hypothetical protein